jgi:hypothetical protein
MAWQLLGLSTARSLKLACVGMYAVLLQVVLGKKPAALAVI